MNNYEFECINYGDAEDKRMPGSWSCLRRVFEHEGVGRWRFAQDKGRIKLARRAFREVGRLARHQCGKVSLLIDPRVGMCMVCLENVEYIQCGNRPEKKRLLEVLARADSFTVTRAVNETLGLDLSYKAFRKIGE